MEEEEDDILNEIVPESYNSLKNVNAGLDEDFEERILRLQEDVDNQFNKILNYLYAKKNRSNT